MDITVIIPTYNRAANFLRRSVGSAMAQQGLRGEVILVDDGSSGDHTSSLSCMDSPAMTLRVLRLPQNLGPGRARNRALSQAQGRYIAFLDSDDCFATSQTLARWVARAERDALEMVLAPFVDARALGKATLRLKRGLSLPNNPIRAADEPRLALVQSFWQFLYCREFLDRHALRFREDARFREDWPFLIPCLAAVERLGSTANPALIYNHDAEARIMRSRSPEIMRDFILNMTSVAIVLRDGLAQGRFTQKFVSLKVAKYFNFTVPQAERWQDHGGEFTALQPAFREATQRLLSIYQSVEDLAGEFSAMGVNFRLGNRQPFAGA